MTAVDIVTFLRLQWDRVSGWLCIGVGMLFLLLGWLGTSNTAYAAQQLPYILSGGIGGVFALGLGGMLLLSADLRDEWRKLDRIEHLLASIPESQLIRPEGQPPNGRTVGSISGVDVSASTVATKKRGTRRSQKPGPDRTPQRITKKSATSRHKRTRQ